MREKQPGVYVITCTVTGNQYVGSSVDIPKRWNGHRQKLRKGKNDCPILQHAWNKHGEDSFVFKVLELVQDISILRIREQYYIDTLQPEYNFAMFTDTPSHDPKVAKKIAATLTGRTLSEEHRKHVGDGQRGKTQPVETNLKRSASMKDNPKIKGVPKPEGYGEADSQRMKNKWQDPVYRAKMIEARRNRKPSAPRSQEARENSRKARTEAWIRQKEEGYENMKHGSDGRFLPRKGVTDEKAV